MLLRRTRHSQPDPMETLVVQWRLSRLAWEIRQLESDENRWARAHHLRAAEIAYDDLLAEACGLAGIPVPVAAPPVRRLIIESDLRVRGWTW
ncbi:MAG TPA: hypothetical protein VFR23_05980 [Jiangellaceae bacterium]|nr:hypothetical protein [Jiangellaceae bacterium]